MSGLIINPYVFAVPAAGGPDGTEYYFTLTVQSAEVSAALTGFPVYVRLADAPAAFWANVQSDGGDIRVTESDGTTRCPVDLVSINTTTEVGELHFLASSLSAVTNTVFRVYYGKTGGGLSQPAITDTYGRNAVWADYELVWHAHADVDSSGNHTLTTTSVTAGNVAGAIGAATSYGNTSSGGTDRTQTGGTVAIGGVDQAFTWQLWAKHGSANSSYRVWSNGRSEVWFDDNTDSFAWVILGSASDTGYLRRNTGNNDAIKSNWWLWHGTYDGSDTTGGMLIYRNGSQEQSGQATGTSQVADGALYIANRAGLDRGLDLEADEFRLRLDELSSEWVAAEYSNQSTPSTFYSVGAQEPA